MTLDLQHLIKFPVEDSFLSFEAVQRSSPAMHMRQHWASEVQIAEVPLSLSLPSQILEAMPLLRI